MGWVIALLVVIIALLVGGFALVVWIGGLADEQRAAIEHERWRRTHHLLGSIVDELRHQQDARERAAKGERPPVRRDW